MGVFFKSLKTELGKNTGKYISNRVFGDKHATPHKHIISSEDRQRRREERDHIRKERLASQERAREESERKREARREEIDRQKLEKAEAKAKLKEEKEKELQENQELYEEYLSYIRSIEKLHTVTSFEAGFKSLRKVQGLSSISVEDMTAFFKNDFIPNSLERIELVLGMFLLFDDTIIDASVFEKLIALYNYKNSDDFEEESKEELEDAYDKLEIPSYLKYFRNVKSDLKRLEEALVVLNEKICLSDSQQTASDIEELKSDLKKVLRSIVGEEKVNTEEVLTNKFGNSWQKKIEIDEKLTKKLSQLNRDIIDLEDAFLGSIRNKKQIKKLEELKEEVYGMFSDDVDDIRSELEKIEKKNRKVNKHLKKLEENFNQDFSSFMEIRDRRIKEKIVELEEEKDLFDLVEGAKNNDPFAIREILSNREIFEFLEDYGSNASVGFNNGVLEVDVYANFEDVIPTNKRTLLASGELKDKPMPATEYNLLVQDYICSCVLRIANDYFLNLWGDSIVINVLITELSSATGNNEDRVILSTQLFREPFEAVNLIRVDASDCLMHLGCNMKFTKSKGFSNVNAVKVLPPKVIKEEKKVELKEPEPIVESPAPSTTKDASSDTRRKRLKIGSGFNVDDLNKALKRFDLTAHIYTSKGSKASGNRKLASLAGESYEDIDELLTSPFQESVKEQLSKVGVPFDLVELS